MGGWTTSVLIYVNARWKEYIYIYIYNIEAKGKEDEKGALKIHTQGRPCIFHTSTDKQKQNSIIQQPKTNSL